MGKIQVDEQGNREGGMRKRKKESGGWEGSGGSS